MIGILASAALVGVPASSAAADPVCLDLLAIEVCLGAPGSGEPAPAPSHPDPQPTEPAPSTPPDPPVESDEPAEEPAPARPSAPVTSGSPAPSGTPSTAPAGTGGSASVTAPSTAPLPTTGPAPSATPTPRPSRAPDAGAAPIVYIDAGQGAAPGTAPLFAAGVMLFGAGALGAAGLAMKRHRAAELEEGEHGDAERSRR